MADPGEPKKVEPTPAAEPAPAATPRRSVLTPLLLLCAGVVIMAAGAGYGLGMLMKGPKAAEAAPPAKAAAPTPAPAGSAAEAKPKDEFVYYDFDPIVANLDEPRLARYVRVVITLAIRPQDAEAARAVLERKKPELKNWVTVFFASCTLEQIRGSANLNRLRREILDALSEQLWPDQKSPIHQVLFKEIAVS
jgi:flagellar basal body-associated protein FliL